MRTGIREQGGTAIIGERWTLDNDEVKTLLDSLNVRALDRQMDHYGDGMGDAAADLYRKLTGENVDEALSLPEPEPLVPVADLPAEDYPPFADDRYWRELDLEPFAVDADTEELPDGVFRLDRLRDKSTFEDRQERTFEKVCDGPQQGSCVIRFGEHFAHYDGGTLVYPPDESAVV